MADMIAARHNFSAFRDRLAILHRMSGVVSACSISTYVPFPFLQNLPTIIHVWIVRRCRGRITRLTWISILLGYLQLAKTNVHLGTVLSLVLRIPHEMVLGGDYAPFPNCVRQQGCIIRFSLHVDPS